MADEVEEIKNRLDLVDFISGYLTLKKAGQNYKSICPFHQEKTPSFMVSKDKQIWKCFGCQKGGDLYDFVMEMENLDFGDALRTLAEKAGVKLQHRKTEDFLAPSIKTTLYKINLLASRLYQEVLLSEKIGKEALDYLKSRQLSPKIIREFQLGFAPDSYDFLEKFLKSKGFSEGGIEQAGLLIRRQTGGFYDRFRHRVMFPISDVMGNIIGFSGRIIEGQEDKEGKDETPKYINSADSPIFHKSQILYGLDKAKVPIKKYQYAVLMEGQMDVILSHQAGVKNAVATSGTAVTPDHLRILSRYSPNLILAFDTDTAGIESCKKAIDLALPFGLSLKIADFLPYKDPGEAASLNLKRYSQALRESKLALDWYFDLAFKNKKATLSVAQKKETAKIILPVISRLGDEIERAHYIQQLSKKLSVSQETIVLALDRVRREGRPRAPTTQFRPTIPLKHNLSAQHLLGLLILYPDAIPVALKRLSSDDFKEPEDSSIYKLLKLWYNLKSRKDKDLPLFLKKNLPSTLSKKADLLWWESKNLHENQDYNQAASEIYQAIQNIRGVKTTALREDLVSQIRSAEEGGDKAKVKKLLLRLQNVSQKK